MGVSAAEITYELFTVSPKGLGLTFDFTYTAVIWDNTTDAEVAPDPGII